MTALHFLNCAALAFGPLYIVYKATRMFVRNQLRETPLTAFVSRFISDRPRFFSSTDLSVVALDPSFGVSWPIF
jgi:hypothetical protein